ncbi:hypothetical protein BJ508DRAFT_414283 [Ascobolus immersus RN42]|uniref:Aminoglycoside phosphotransferase domain-containing protein n=1 Tax=Ascobolus immersus RN42 TaxID=1160509 RepID=A0A3N4IDM7_ASCIM|nr:hypothetical protein BJ508DRAFT_414283 [Ascobolus immersus RN42]
MAKLSLPPSSLQSLLSALLSNTVLTSSTELSTPLHLNTVYHLKTTAGSFTLKLPPSPSARILRYERHLFPAEHMVTSFLSSQGILPAHPSNGTYIYDPSHELINTSFILKPYLEGQALSTPTKEALAWLKKLNSLTSPTGGYGFFQDATHSTYQSFFLSLFESVLLDGEELLVLLPYEQIRGELAQWKWCLEVEHQTEKEGCFVVFDLALDEILVDGDGKVKGLAGGWERGCWGTWELQNALRGEALSKEYFGENWTGDLGHVGRARLLLHDLLAATCRIVTLFYRQAAMSDEEMSHRKKLVGILQQLSELRSTK